MNELEEKLNALLSNPQLMQQVAGLAQAMGGTKTEQTAPSKEEEKASLPVMDPRQMQLIMQAMNHTDIDNHQHALLLALSPYLSTSRISKLERAMRAAKIAGAASLLFSSSNLRTSAGR